MNFFQRSMKWLTKQRDQGQVHRKYDPARTSLQRLLATDTLNADPRTRLETIYPSLDPLGLLNPIATLPDALWQLAVLETPAATPEEASTAPTDVRSSVGAGRIAAAAANTVGVSAVAEGVAPPLSAERRKRKHHRTQKPREPHWWRTRADPFEAVWEELRR